MIIRRIFTFPIATLYTVADLILTTAESPEEKPLIDARLEDGHVAATRALLSELNPDGEATHLIRGHLGTMSQSQRDAIKKVNKFKTHACKSARLFPKPQTADKDNVCDSGLTPQQRLRPIPACILLRNP